MAGVVHSGGLGVTWGGKMRIGFYSHAKEVLAERSSNWQSAGTQKGIGGCGSHRVRGGALGILRSSFSLYKGGTWPERLSNMACVAQRISS